MKRLGDVKGNLSAIVAEKAINEERAKNLQEMLSAKKASLDDAETSLSIYDTNVKKGKEEMRALSQKNNETLSEKLEAQEAIKGLEADVMTLNSKLGLAEGQLRCWCLSRTTIRAIRRRSNSSCATRGTIRR